MDQAAIIHSHTLKEACKQSCSGYNKWDDYPAETPILYKKNDGGWEIYRKPSMIAKIADKEVSPFDKDSYYPIPPLGGMERAFLWWAKDTAGEKGDVFDSNLGHWRIIDNFKNAGDIYPWLKQAEKSPIPMLWGYMVQLPDNKMYIKFLTHLSPGKQDLEYIQPCLRDLELHYNREVSDYDIEDTTTPIVESYTSPNAGGSAWSEKKEPTELDYSEQELKTIRKDVLNDGIMVITTFLGSIAPNPEEPFETMVLDDEDEANPAKEIHYSQNERDALNSHYRLVDLYNRQALNKSGSTETHEPFMFYNDKLYFGKKHHDDILSRSMNEDGHSYEDFTNTPPTFGWYHKPRGIVRFSTDTGYQSYNFEDRQKVKDLLEYKFGKPVTEDPDWWDWEGWNDEQIPKTEDVTYKEYLDSGGPSQIRLISAEIPGQLSLTSPSEYPIQTVEVDPGDEAHHSENEHPFMYHVGAKTLFYTTKDCHHHHIVPMVNKHLASENYEPVGPWITGDITDSNFDGRNWIKFISSDTGQYPESVINYLQDKFGPREVIYSGQDGWEPLPEKYIQKDSKKVSNVQKKDRKAEWRWSYHPSSKKLDVWEVYNGNPNHFAKTGISGQQECVQGRIYILDDNKIRAFYWSDRPWHVDSPYKERVQQEGWAAVSKWIADNNIGDMYAEATGTT